MSPAGATVTVSPSPSAALIRALRQNFLGRVDTDKAIEQWAPSPDGVNEAFLREVMAYIELHPELWDQQNWANARGCGTAHCMAGWAYVLGTGRDLWVNSQTMTVEPTELVVEAGKLLGLSVTQAVALFNFAAITGYDEYGSYFSRHPTFQEFCDKVERVTGVTFKPAPEVA